MSDTKDNVATCNAKQSDALGRVKSLNNLFIGYLLFCNEKTEEADQGVISLYYELEAELSGRLNQ